MEGGRERGQECAPNEAKGDIGGGQEASVPMKILKRFSLLIHWI